jgi:hypothetical protein
MRKLRPGVARVWRRLEFHRKVNAAFAKALQGLMGNFYADSPFQGLLRQRKNSGERESVRTDG